MTAAQYRRVRDVFESALDRLEPERASFVERACADDPVVRDEVLSLLDHATRAGSFLSVPALDASPELAFTAILTPGTEVGPYTVVREVGRGGMGVVYVATDRRLGRTVALKALAPHLVRDEASRERLRREARAAAALSHPGICTIYALEEVDGDVFMATEFVDGRTLRDEIESTPPPSPGTIVSTAREIASALASAHAHGIVHRDLKPENVMRTAAGHVKILDFGLADVESDAAPRHPSPGTLIGTPAYMSPEQLTGRPTDARTDIFALGVLLYEFATHAHPFAADTALGGIARTLESEPAAIDVLRPGLPPDLIAIVTKCLRKPPAERYQAAADIVAALDRTSGRGTAVTWWRVHQLVVIALYAGAAALGWQLKEWAPGAATTSAFMALGIGATVGGVLRGHTLFTERVNGARLAAERRRTARAVLSVDLAIAVALLVDAAWFAGRPVTALLVSSLAIVIALAAAVLEPATTRAAFSEG